MLPLQQRLVLDLSQSLEFTLFTLQARRFFWLRWFIIPPIECDFVDFLSLLDASGLTLHDNWKVELQSGKMLPFSDWKTRRGWWPRGSFFLRNFPCTIPPHPHPHNAANFTYLPHLHHHAHHCPSLPIMLLLLILLRSYSITTLFINL